MKLSLPEQPQGAYHAPMGLFGRELEVEALGRAIGKLEEGGRVVTVSGDAGSGKTALVSTVLDAGVASAPGRQPRVLRGLCDPLETPRPLGPIRDVIAALGGISWQRGGETSDLERDLLDVLAREPSVLVIEDAQWIDAGSAEVLRFLIRRMDPLPVLIVITYRDGDVGPGHSLTPILGEIARSERSERIEVGPLPVGAVADVLAGTGLDAERVFTRTAGNPFFVTEIARHPDEELPRTVRDAVIASTFGLDTADVEVLQLIAAAPDAVDDRLLPQLGIDVPTLRRLESTGLLVRTGRGIAFRHELARLAITDSTPLAVAPYLHLRLLDAFDGIGSTDHAVLTHHAVAAGDTVRALRSSRLAADEAMRSGSHTEAVAFLVIALDHSIGETEERADLLASLSEEQYMISRLEDARQSARASLQIRERLGDPDGIAQAHDRRAIIEYYAAHRHDAQEQADLAATAGAAAAATASAQATRAYLAYRHQDLADARAIAAAARQVIATAGDGVEAARRRLAITEAASELLEGGIAGREALLAEAKSALDVSLDEIGTTAYSNLSAIDIEHRRLSEAESVLAESIPLTIERDIPICNQWQTGMRARLHFLRGRWTASGEDASTVIDHNGAPLATVWPHILSGLLELRRGGDAAIVDAHLDRAWEHAHALDEAQMLLAVLSARAEQAWQTTTRHPVLDQAESLVARADALPGNAWAIGELLVWLDRIGMTLPAQQIAEPYELELAGRHSDAQRLWEALGAPFESAMTALHDPRSSVAVPALEHLQQLGLDGTAGRARTILLDRGIRSVPAPARRSTRNNPGGLTNRQLDVARLVAQGLTNSELAERLYISPKTADHHVSAVLAKLELPSRRDIVRSADRLGLSPPAAP